MIDPLFLDSLAQTVCGERSCLLAELDCNDRAKAGGFAMKFSIVFVLFNLRCESFLAPDSDEDFQGVRGM
jgi:hypothetical protein